MTATSAEDGSFLLKASPTAHGMSEKSNSPRDLSLDDTVFPVEISKNDTVIEIEIVNEYIHAISR